MTKHCLPSPFPFKTLWQLPRSKARLEHLPVKLGVNYRVPPPLPLPSPQPKHWEHQGPGKCILIHSSYLWPSENLLHWLPFRKPSIKQNILEVIIKCRLISIEIFSPFLFVSRGWACFCLNSYTRVRLSLGDFGGRERRSISYFSLRVFNCRNWKMTWRVISLATSSVSWWPSWPHRQCLMRNSWRNPWRYETYTSCFCPALDYQKEWLSSGAHLRYGCKGDGFGDSVLSN